MRTNENLFGSNVPKGLRLFGGLELVTCDGPITLGQARLEELVAFLAVHAGEAISRAQIAYRLWPESTESQARTNTRHVLFRLKQAWPGIETAVRIDRSTATWRSDAAFVVDVHEFRELLAQAAGTEDPIARASLLSSAADCYRGEFLPDCYSEWALAEREQYHGKMSSLLQQLVDALVELRRYKDALERARQLVEHDPVQELAYRRLMRIHMLLGDRAAALMAFHACASILHKELGVEPSPATLQLRAELLQRAEFEPAAQPAPQVVERPRLIGRHPEWQQLQKAWRDATEGNAQCVLVWGEAGIGKTRLAEELIGWVRRQGYVCASSRSYAAEGALTYAPIAEWIRYPSIRDTVSEADPLWQVEIARLLPELLSENDDLPPPGPLLEAWQQHRFYQSIVQVLQAVSGPLLLHLDDMQWSDQELLTLLHFLLHSARHHPLLVLGTIRIEDAPDNPGLATLADALRQSNQLVELVLDPLSEEESFELAELTAGKSVPDEQNAALYDVSEGHPLFVIEAVRSEFATEAAPERRAVQSSRPDQIPGTHEIPPKVFDLLAARLRQLSPEAQLVATAAAVIGHSFTYELLLATTHVDEATLVDALDELWTRRIVTEQEGDRYDFCHDRIREVAYQQISRARRRLLHSGVAEALQVLRRQDVDTVAGQLAAHYAQARDAARAYEYYRRAAEVALSQHALSRASELLDAALRHVPDDPVERIMTLIRQNHIFKILLDFDRWSANVEKEQKLLAAIDVPTSNLMLEVQLDSSSYFAEGGAGSSALETARTALEEAEKLGADIALARAHQAVARSYWMQARMARAAHHYGLSTDHARLAGDQEIELVSMELHAATGMFSGMPASEILERITRAYRLAEAVGNKHRIASLHNKFGYLVVAQGSGEHKFAEEQFRQGLDLCREIGDQNWEAIILCNLGMLFIRMGDYRQALSTLSAGMAIESDQPQYWRQFVTRHHIGTCWMEMGCLEQAHSDLTEASEKLRLRGNHHFEIKARADLGLLYWLTGDNCLAEKELVYSLEQLDGYGDLRFEALVNTRLGYVLEAMDRLEEACSRYERGRALHSQMEQHLYAVNALAGCARVAQLRGDCATAQTHAEAVWDALKDGRPDLGVETIHALRTCYNLFVDHDDARNEDVLRTAWTQLRRRAQSIDDPEKVARFWDIGSHDYFRQVAAKAGLHQ